MSHLELVALPSMTTTARSDSSFDVLQFDLVEDTPSLTNAGGPKQWVVVRPTGGQTGILLARADGEQQTRVVGQQFGGRVGMFLRVDDFDAAYQPCSGPVFSSSRPLATSDTGASLCFSMLRETAGTFSDRIRGDNDAARPCQTPSRERLTGRC
jgi:hypothetical protein